MATPNTDPYREGGWWCWGRCQRFVEVDTESREQTVCARCHRATVRYHAPGRQDIKQTVRVQGHRLSREEAHAFFERMRAAVV